MFAGIIERKVRILSVEPMNGMIRVRIQKPREWKLTLGQSIDVDGICSTVVQFSAGTFDVEYMPETVSKTTASMFKKDRIVNLERSLTYGQRIDGHPVQGHVDAAVPIREIRARGSSRELTIRPSASLARQAILHGSLAINGVSLTIARKEGATITVALIPHTLAQTNFDDLSTGDLVNVEFDHSADYVATMRKK